MFWMSRSCPWYAKSTVEHSTPVCCIARQRAQSHTLPPFPAAVLHSSCKASTSVVVVRRGRRTQSGIETSLSCRCTEATRSRAAPYTLRQRATRIHSLHAFMYLDARTGGKLSPRESRFRMARLGIHRCVGQPRQLGWQRYSATPPRYPQAAAQAPREFVARSVKSAGTEAN